jgi:hypothetical protein
MVKLSKKALREEAKIFVEFAISGLLPTVAYADKAIEMYNMRPCVLTGSNRQEAEKLAMEAIIKTRKLLWNTWKKEFKGAVSAKEYCELMDEALKKLRPEGEKTKSEGVFWFGKVGKELNGKEVK